VAYLSPHGDLLEYASVPTRGRALSAVHDCLQRLEGQMGVFDPRAAGVTGSGRKLVGEMMGADLTINEITAHAAGGTAFVSDVRTIFDIGGQDSKFIQLDGGRVVGFEMNKVCAAGTGSFIEEMAELLGVAIVGEFAQEALSSKSPVELGERCTVFIGSELTRRLQQGYRRADLAAGLCYAVAYNYLARVVGRHAIDEPVVFQGGVANNPGVVAALKNVLQREIQVHPYNDVAGAVGSALLAGRHNAGGSSRFRGTAAIEPEAIRSTCFECQKCENHCDIHQIRSGAGQKFFSGGLCDRFEGRSAVVAADDDGRVDLFNEREQALNRWVRESPHDQEPDLGIPRALVQHDMLPFWSVFLNELGVSYQLSAPTTRDTVERGARLSHANTCLPLKIAYGHCAELTERGVRRILVPSVANLGVRTVAERLDHLCPAAQAWPYTARAILGADAEFLAPRVRCAIPHLVTKDIAALGDALGAGRHRTLRAFREAVAALDAFHGEMVLRGRELLRDRQGTDTLNAIILTRSYTVGDPQIWLRLKQVFDDVDMVPVPMDMVPDEPQHSDALYGMYWLYGKRMLQAARALKPLGDLPAVFLSTFACGPDSFITHMLRRELGDVPLLELELDEHSAFTGVHTRLEAFKYSLASRRPRGSPPPPPRTVPRRALRERELLIPQMSDHAHAVCAAFRSCNIAASVLPLPDSESTALGKLALGGNECLPCSLVLGDMLRHLRDRNGKGPPPAFFMISGDGPCRLGQYPWLHRVVLNELGHGDVPIFNASQDQTFYEQFGVVPSSFKRRAWRGMVAADVLFRKWREARSRAVDRTEADVTYRNGLARLSACIERRGDLAGMLRHALGNLCAVTQRPDQPSVTIGMLGENYVRCNSAANNGIAELLEELGADVWFPSLCEWVEYTNWTAQLHCRYERQYLRMLHLMSIDALQRLETRLLNRLAKGRLRNRTWPSRREVFRLAEPYVPRTFEGETIVGVGRTVDLSRRGVDGVIHVSPFGCIVGGIVETLCERLSDDLHGFPILTLQFDGQNSELTRSKLDGFLLRASEWRRERESHGDAWHS
jgi:predicted CoA-substrate-specific enzyme activase